MKKPEIWIGGLILAICLCACYISYSCGFVNGRVFEASKIAGGLN